MRKGDEEDSKLGYAVCKTHWPGAPASDVPNVTKLNRPLPAQCSPKLGGMVVIDLMAQVALSPKS